MTFSNVPFANLDRFLIVEMASTSSTPTFEKWDRSPVEAAAPPLTRPAGDPEPL